MDQIIAVLTESYLMSLTEFTWQQLVALLLILGCFAAVFVTFCAFAFRQVIRAMSDYEDFRAKRGLYGLFRRKQ